jgi:tetratricopeptide (TPR) repeat protein
VALAQGKFDRARAYIEDSLGLYRELGYKAASPIQNPQGHEGAFAAAYLCLGQVHYLQDRLIEAGAHFEIALKIFNEIDDLNGKCWASPWLGCVAYRAGNLDQAKTLIEAALPIHDPDGHWADLAFALLSLGDVMQAQGDPTAAAKLYARSLTLVVEHRARSAVAPYLEAYARLALAGAQPDRAARLLGAAAALRDQIGTPVPPVERSDYGRTLAQARDQLGPAAFDAAWIEARALSWKQAAAYALETDNALTL